VVGTDYRRSGAVREGVGAEIEVCTSRYALRMSNPTQLPPPGWYPNAAGEMQWWDGAAWGPPAAPAPQNKPRRGLALSALLVGIGAFLAGWVPIVGAIVGAVGIVLAIVALTKRQPKSLAITGLSLASVALVASIAMTVSFVFFQQNRSQLDADGSTSVASAPATEEAQPEAAAPAPEPQQVKTDAEYRDEAMTADGWDVYESGNLYVQFVDPADFTCGYANCTFVHVATIRGCPNSLYVEASLMSGDTVIGMTNDMLGVVGPEGTATAHLEDFAGNADGYRLTKVNCY
jgi:hypothetical protein